MTTTTTMMIYKLSILGYVLVIAIGWLMNVAKLADSNFDVITGMIVLRAIGVVFVPLGSLLGFL